MEVPLLNRLLSRLMYSFVFSREVLRLRFVPKRSEALNDLLRTLPELRRLPLWLNPRPVPVPAVPPSPAKGRRPVPVMWRKVPAGRGL